MLTLKSESDVKEAQLPPKHRRAATRAVRSLIDAYGDDYDPETTGFVVFVDKETTDADAIEMMGSTWATVQWESVLLDKETECFVATWLANNQYGLIVLVPDAEWVAPAFRASLLNELEA